VHSLILTVVGDRYPDRKSSRENPLKTSCKKKQELEKKGNKMYCEKEQTNKRS